MMSHFDSLRCSDFGQLLICSSLDLILLENAIKRFLAIFGGRLI